MPCRGIIVAGAAAALLAGCGGSSPKTSSTSKTPSTSSVVTTAPPTSRAPQPAIAHRLLRNSEMPAGFSAAGDPSVYPTIAQWLGGNQTPANQMASETARLKRLGFVAGATLNLNSAKGPGLSLLEQFRTPAGARDELLAQANTFARSTGFERFAVPGIPTSVGFGFSGNGVNVSFANGDYYYLVGEAVRLSAANEAAVVASAKKLYQRVRG